MNRQETASFISFGIAESGVVLDESAHAQYPLVYYNIIDGFGAQIRPGNSYFVFIYEGEAQVGFGNEDGIRSALPKDTYFSHHGLFTMVGTFKAICIEVIADKGKYGETGYRAMTQIGGPVEEKGRLKYIDGCTDSLLISPVKKGDPCFNHLHFPPNITQTAHTHPSHRIGVVIRGEGECVTPFGVLPLVEGCIFVIKEYTGTEMRTGLDGKQYEAGTHKFDTKDSNLDVIAFHPDSDFGPEDEFHPMINRTIVDGVSANSIDEIKTK